MSCAEPSGHKKSDINGKCSACGEPTVDGTAFERCAWSPVVCKKCDRAPCDESC